MEEQNIFDLKVKDGNTEVTVRELYMNLKVHQIIFSQTFKKLTEKGILNDSDISEMNENINNILSSNYDFLTPNSLDLKQMMK